MLRDRFAVFGRVDRRVRRLIDARPFQRRHLDHRAADLPGEFRDVDLVAFFFDKVDHVDRDNHRDAQFGQLRGQIQVSLEVGAVNDVQDRVGAFSDQIVSRHDFFERVGRE